MKVEIELTEEDVKKLVLAEIQRKSGDINLKLEDIKIEVKSKQNYKSEWEPADFRARVSVSL